MPSYDEHTHPHVHTNPHSLRDTYSSFHTRQDHTRQDHTRGRKNSGSGQKVTDPTGSIFSTLLHVAPPVSVSTLN
jgi:hypothetical protein